MRPLVLCYSLNGRTAAVARELACRLDAEYGEIRCPRYEGLFGWFFAMLDVALARMPPIVLPETLMSASRQIIIGGPIWSGRACGPVLTAMDGRLRACYDLMIFLSYGRMENVADVEHAFADARRVFGSPFQAYSSVSFTELERSAVKATAGRLARLFHMPGG